MTKKFNQYIGKAGHLAVMSEFLMRGWNVAIPEVDVGDDIFVVEDEKGLFRRVQVKTATATNRKGTFSAKFQLSIKQLSRTSDVMVHYVFITRHNEMWTKPIIIRQDFLLDHFENNKVGSQYEGNLTLYFSYTDDKVDCSGQDFTKYIGGFGDFQKIEH